MKYFLLVTGFLKLLKSMIKNNQNSTSMLTIVVRMAKIAKSRKPKKINRK